MNRVQEICQASHRLFAVSATEVLSNEDIYCSLEIDHENLIVGQIAYMVDEGILKLVMSNIGVKDPYKERSISTIRQMEKAIDKKRRFTDVFHSEEEREVIEKRWEELKDGIGWKNKHYRDIDYLKEFRFGSSYPHVDFGKLGQSIDKVCSRNPRYKGACKEFYKMLQTMNSMGQ